MIDLSLLPDGGMAWLDGSGPSSHLVLSTRIRLARNLETYPFSPRSSGEQREAVLGDVLAAARETVSLRDALVFRLDRLAGADIRPGGTRAYYAQEPDYIRMPPFEAFESPESYYATLAHESTHWTKHPARLAREFGRKQWGDEGYAEEELVAELGAAFLCADLELSLTPREDHASYIAHWLTVLKNDKRAIFRAASHAGRAADFLHGLQPPA